jgi:hypothetical protein
MDWEIKLVCLQYLQDSLETSVSSSTAENYIGMQGNEKSSIQNEPDLTSRKS